MKKILVLVPGYLPGFKSGGPVRTVANMIEALGDEITFNVVCMDRDLGDDHPYTSIRRNAWNKQGKANVFYIQRGLSGILKLIHILRNLHCDIVHINGFLPFQFSILPLILLRIFRKNVSVILGPRGEFSLGALALKKNKKKIFIYFAKLTGLYNDVIWHASSPHEADDIRRSFSDSANIRIAIDIAEAKSNIKISKREPSQPLRVVFISRISPKKNLQFAISLLTEITVPLVFDVYGPIEDLHYWRTCIETAKLLPSNIQFNYNGSLHPNDVTQTLANYDLFLFPTLGENFGHVIAEALLAGLPVLISDQTPWRQLSKINIGWDVPLSNKVSFLHAIKKCLDYSEDEYHTWRNHIRDWAMHNIGNQEAIDATRRLFSIK